MAKRVCSVVLALVMALALVPTVRAADVLGSGKCGDFATWTLYSDGLLKISGTGKMKNYGAYSSTPWYEYKEIITQAVIENGITSIL